MPEPPHGFYRPNRGLYHSKVWQTFRWFGQQFILFPTDTIKAAPHSFSNEGDAFSRFSGLLVLSRSIMICDRGCRNPPTIGRNYRRRYRSECVTKNNKHIVLARPSVSLPVSRPVNVYLPHLYAVGNVQERHLKNAFT